MTQKEESEILQIRASESVAAFVDFCNSPLFTGKSNPSDKIVKNLFTFLCQDISLTPVFALGPESTQGILSLKDERQPVPKKTAAGVKEMPEETEEQIASRITRRGALQSFTALAERFRGDLFNRVPVFWHGLSAPFSQLESGGTFPADAVVPRIKHLVISIEEMDLRLSNDILAGQSLIDSLTALRFIAPMLDPSLQARLSTLFPSIIGCLSSSFSVVRITAAKCLAALCDIMTEDGMRQVVDSVVPLVGDARRTYSRQGAVEAIHRAFLTAPSCTVR